MVFMGMSKLGKMDLIFVDPGVEINGTCYRDVLLTVQLLHKISGEFCLRETVIMHTNHLNNRLSGMGDTL